MQLQNAKCKFKIRNANAIAKCKFKLRNANAKCSRKTVGERHHKIAHSGDKPMWPQKCALEVPKKII